MFKPVTFAKGPILMDSSSKSLLPVHVKLLAVLGPAAVNVAEPLHKVGVAGVMEDW